MKFMLVDRSQTGFARYCPTFAKPFQKRKARQLERMKTEEYRLLLKEKKVAEAADRIERNPEDLVHLKKLRSAKQWMVRGNVAVTCSELIERGMDLSNMLDDLDKLTRDSESQWAEDDRIPYAAGEALWHAAYSEKTSRRAFEIIKKNIEDEGTCVGTAATFRAVVEKGIRPQIMESFVEMLRGQDGDHPGIKYFFHRAAAEGCDISPAIPVLGTLGSLSSCSSRGSVCLAIAYAGRKDTDISDHIPVLVKGTYSDDYYEHGQALGAIGIALEAGYDCSDALERITELMSSTHDHIRKKAAGTLLRFLPDDGQKAFEYLEKELLDKGNTGLVHTMHALLERSGLETWIMMVGLIQRFVVSPQFMKLAEENNTHYESLVTVLDSVLRKINHSIRGAA